MNFIIFKIIFCEFRAPLRTKFWQRHALPLNVHFAKLIIVLQYEIELS